MSIVITQLVRQRLAIILLFTTILRAETTSKSSTTNPLVLLPPAKIPSLNLGTSPQALSEPASSTPPDSSDRKSGAGAAQGMAIAATAIAGAMCAMMMAQAQQMPPGPEKTMMMTQAMQQCAQAAANAKNAGENEKAKNAVVINDTAKGQQQNAKNPEKNDTVSPAQKDESEEEKPSEASLEGPNLNEPSLTGPAALPVPTDFRGSGDFVGAVANGNGSSTPKSIENAEVSFNENNKGNEQKLYPPGSPFGGVGGGNGLAGTLGGATADGKEAGKGKRDAKDSESSATTAEAAEGQTGAGSGGTAFDKMLSDLMGGKQEPIPVFGEQSGVLVLKYVGDKKMTIFELAGARYRRAGYSEGLVDIRKPRRFREPASIPDVR